MSVRCRNIPKSVCEKVPESVTSSLQSNRIPEEAQWCGGLTPHAGTRSARASVSGGGGVCRRCFRRLHLNLLYRMIPRFCRRRNVPEVAVPEERDAVNNLLKFLSRGFTLHHLLRSSLLSRRANIRASPTAQESISLPSLGLSLIYLIPKNLFRFKNKQNKHKTDNELEL